MFKTQMMHCTLRSTTTTSNSEWHCAVGACTGREVLCQAPKQGALCQGLTCETVQLDSHAPLGLTEQGVRPKAFAQNCCVVITYNVATWSAMPPAFIQSGRTELHSCSRMFLADHCRLILFKILRRGQSISIRSITLSKFLDLGVHDYQ